MTTTRGTFASLIYSLIRLSPLVAPMAIIPAIPEDPQLADLFMKRSLALLVTLITWNMAEGTMILWMKAKSEASERARGYLVSTIICAVFVLAVLQYFRLLSTQGMFLILLATLSVRGMSRSGWENARPLAGFVGAIVGNSLITLLSFLMIVPAIDWQSVACSIAIGTSVASVEAGWYAESFKAKRGAWWPLPLFRAALCLGPIIIATLGLARQLPALYILVYATVLLAGRVLKRINQAGEIPSTFLTGSAGIYVIFLTIMSLCRVYESGWRW